MYGAHSLHILSLSVDVGVDDGIPYNHFRHLYVCYRPKLIKAFCTLSSLFFFASSSSLRATTCGSSARYDKHRA